MWLGAGASLTSPAWSRAPFSDYPFRLGVASGDPLPFSVVLWTRLAVDPLAADGRGGMSQRSYAVRWELAEDERFRRVVRRGVVTATPDLGHSVHPEVWGLRPGHEYFYRFSVGSEVSPVGRTKTAPAPWEFRRRLDFAFASCASFAAGYYTAYRHLAEEDLDVVLHLGDYLYEYGMDEFGGARSLSESIGTQFAGETLDLARYRLQYGLYKSDPDLMAAHASAPFIVTFDDHEVENNWADEIPEASSQTPGVAFLARRTAAFQAYYENLPLRSGQLPSGPDIQVYRSLSYGRLLDFNVLDTRQYRDDQPYGDGVAVPGPETTDPNTTMMGWEQEAWLRHRFRRNQGRWQVLANQAPMAETDRDPGEGKLVWTDPWDGYDANRRRVLESARQLGVDNLVVITGDRHTNYVNDLQVEYGAPDGDVFGTEFVGTSITSGGDGADMIPAGEQYLASNPHMKFFNSQRGYVRCRVTPDTFTSDYRVVPFVTRPGAPISTRASWAVEHGVPGATLAYEGGVTGRKFGRNMPSEADLDTRRAGDPARLPG
ncbi:alkaline phosphatase D family protein [Nocardioides insulae]|uniref:alkaline phosphatase D family protein n=1 Tax=Nocardioides insulae TaxID=394734 RepID=UPI001FE05813|nr:alkaline phosphatase D family protein [Nocardioides insulae]